MECSEFDNMRDEYERILYQNGIELEPSELYDNFTGPKSTIVENMLGEFNDSAIDRMHWNDDTTDTENLDERNINSIVDIQLDDGWYRTQITDYHPSQGSRTCDILPDRPQYSSDPVGT